MVVGEVRPCRDGRGVGERCSLGVEVEAGIVVVGLGNMRLPAVGRAGVGVVMEYSPLVRAGVGCNHSSPGRRSWCLRRRMRTRSCHRLALLLRFSCLVSRDSSLLSALDWHSANRSVWLVVGDRPARQPQRIGQSRRRQSRASQFERKLFSLPLLPPPLLAFVFLAISQIRSASLPGLGLGSGLECLPAELVFLPVQPFGPPVRFVTATCTDRLAVRRSCKENAAGEGNRTESSAPLA